MRKSGPPVSSNSWSWCVQLLWKCGAVHTNGDRRCGRTEWAKEDRILQFHPWGKLVSHSFEIACSIRCGIVCAWLVLVFEVGLP